MKKQLVFPALLMSVFVTPSFADFGDKVENRLDNKGDRIENRF